MITVLKRVVRNEKGQVLPMALALLVLSGLWVVPGLNYAMTNLTGTRVVDDGVKGGYAADAAIEEVIWSLMNNLQPPQQLQGINQMNVITDIELKGFYTLYLDQLIQGSVHNPYLTVSGDITWDAAANAYLVTITVTYQPGGGVPVIHLEEIGARLPRDYSYQDGSAALFGGNLSLEEPDKIVDSRGMLMVKWEFDEPRPSVSQNNPTRTQKFYITGGGNQHGNYRWVVAAREDIGLVGEISGNLYRITATATPSGSSRASGKIVADALINGSTVYIVQWQVVK
ncbi:MAG: hypothetical protein HY667_02360 [Chloroflexi bacterium]|nr:hypothetical protein [Chloroflexota bacterium]